MASEQMICNLGERCLAELWSALWGTQVKPWQHIGTWDRELVNQKSRIANRSGQHSPDRDQEINVKHDVNNNVNNAIINMHY